MVKIARDPPSIAFAVGRLRDSFCAPWLLWRRKILVTDAELAAGAANISLLRLNMRDGPCMKGWLRRRPA